MEDFFTNYEYDLYVMQVFYNVLNYFVICILFTSTEYLIIPALFFSGSLFHEKPSWIL